MLSQLSLILLVFYYSGTPLNGNLGIAPTSIFPGTFIICETGIWSEQEILINALIGKVSRKWIENPRRIL